MLPKNVRTVQNALDCGHYQAINGIPKLEYKNLQSWSKEMYDTYSSTYDETKSGLDFLDGIEGMSFSPSKLSLEQLKQLLTTFEAFNITNEVPEIESLACRNFEPMETLAVIANDLEAFKKLNVEKVVSYHNKALIVFIDTKKFKGSIIFIVNGMDLYDVWQVNGAISKKDITNVISDTDCFNIQKELINHYTN